MLARTPACRLPSLDFAITPSGPDQPRRFRSRQPSIAALAFLRQDHLDDCRAKAFSAMVVYRSAKVFKFAPRRRRRAALPGIFAAAIAVNIAQRIASKEP